MRSSILNNLAKSAATVLNNAGLVTGYSCEEVIVKGIKFDFNINGSEEDLHGDSEMNFSMDSYALQGMKIHLKGGLAMKIKEAFSFDGDDITKEEYATKKAEAEAKAAAAAKADEEYLELCRTREMELHQARLEAIRSGRPEPKDEDDLDS